MVRGGARADSAGGPSSLGVAMSIAMPRTSRLAGATAIAGLALAALVLTTGHAGGDDDGGGRPRASVDRSATPARSAYPASMDALGASVAAGYNTDCPD